MTETLPATVRTAPDILFQDLGDTAVLLNLANETYFSLNEVGAQLWRSFAEDGSTAAAMATVLERFDVDDAVLRTDTGALIDALTTAGLVEVA